MLAIFTLDGSFSVADYTTFASNLGASYFSSYGSQFAAFLLLDRPVISVDVVDVPALVVGQPFPELGPNNFNVSVTPSDGYDVTSAAVTAAGWCTASDWRSFAAGAVVQLDVSYGLLTAVEADSDLCGVPRRCWALQAPRRLVGCWF